MRLELGLPWVQEWGGESLLNLKCGATKRAFDGGWVLGRWTWELVWGGWEWTGGAGERPAERLPQQSGWGIRPGRMSVRGLGEREGDLQVCLSSSHKGCWRRTSYAFSPQSNLDSPAELPKALCKLMATLSIHPFFSSQPLSSTMDGLALFFQAQAVIYAVVSVLSMTLRLLHFLHLFKTYFGASQAAQQLRLCASMAGGMGPSLIWEVRSCMSPGEAKKKRKETF